MREIIVQYHFRWIRHTQWFLVCVLMGSVQWDLVDKLAILDVYYIPEHTF
jgi:hypothetical protein